MNALRTSRKRFIKLLIVISTITAFKVPQKYDTVGLDTVLGCEPAKLKMSKKTDTVTLDTVLQRYCIFNPTVPYPLKTNQYNLTNKLDNTFQNKVRLLMTKLGKNTY